MKTFEPVDAYDMLATGKPVLDLSKPYNDEKHLSPNYTLIAVMTQPTLIRDVILVSRLQFFIITVLCC